MASEKPIAAPRLSDDVVRNHVACNLCGSHERVPFLPEKDLGTVQCKRCGLVYVSPRPESHELYALYSETYFHNDESGVVGYSDYVRDERNIRQTARRRLAFVERFTQPGRLLDVGCAAGFFADEARARGWQAEGLDISSFAVAYTRDRFSLPVYHGSFTALDLPQSTYDLITMWDVIEHVPDPQGYIERAAELLRPGGILTLATPDVDSLPAKIMGTRWVGYKLSDEHIYYFSATTLRQMLEKAGFEIVNVRHIGKFVTMNLFLDRFGMYFPWLARLLQMGERAFGLSEWSAYINPFDIVAFTARKRG